MLPLIALGQDQTPAEAADQALRARVTEFLQYHVDGNFRKAYDMVADDTKEEYFNSGKSQLQSFKIDDIKFTDNFTKATVTATMSKMVAVVGQALPADDGFDDHLEDRERQVGLVQRCQGRRRDTLQSDSSRSSRLIGRQSAAPIPGTMARRTQRPAEGFRPENHRGRGTRASCSRSAWTGKKSRWRPTDLPTTKLFFTTA